MHQHQLQFQHQMQQHQQHHMHQHAAAAASYQSYVNYHSQHGNVTPLPIQPMNLEALHAHAHAQATALGMPIENKTNHLVYVIQSPTKPYEILPNNNNMSWNRTLLPSDPKQFRLTDCIRKTIP